MKPIFIGCVRKTEIFADPLFFAAFAAAILCGQGAYMLIFLPAFAMHELTHIGVAYMLSCPVNKITFYPIGGSMEPEFLFAADHSKQYIIYAFAPLVNVMLYSLLRVISMETNSIIAAQMAYANGLLAIFSCIPICPLDGGNILKLFLESLMKKRTAANALFAISIIFSSVLLIYSVYCYFAYHTIIWQSIIISTLFIYSSAKEKNQSSATAISSIIKKKIVIGSHSALDVNNCYISSSAKISDALKNSKNNKFNVFTVVDSKFNEVGVITETQLLDIALKYNSKVTMHKAVNIKNSYSNSAQM